MRVRWACPDIARFSRRESFAGWIFSGDSFFLFLLLSFFPLLLLLSEWHQKQLLEEEMGEIAMRDLLYPICVSFNEGY